MIPSPWCLARVRDRQARHGRRPHRPQAQAVGHGAAEGPGLDRGADPGGVRRRTSRSARPWRRTTRPARTTRCSTSTASCARASRRPARPPRPCWTTSTSTPSATTWPRSVATRSTRSWVSSRRWLPRCCSIEDIVATIRHIVALHAGETDHAGQAGRRGRRHPRRGRRHRPLRQPSPAHRRRADPEPGPHRSVPHGARRPRADDHAGRRGDHAADADQHPARRRLHQGVLRHQPAVASSWTRTTRWRV